MAVFKAEDLQPTPDVKNPNIKMVQHGGDLIKIGLVTYQESEGPLPHSHPNDEQYIYVLEGKAAQLLDDEITTVEPGDIVHIPRNTIHGIRILEGPFRFFSCKSPAGTGQLSEDYNEAPNAAELHRRLAEYS